MKTYLVYLAPGEFPIEIKADRVEWNSDPIRFFANEKEIVAAFMKDKIRGVAEKDAVVKPSHVGSIEDFGDS